MISLHSRPLLALAPCVAVLCLSPSTDAFAKDLPARKTPTKTITVSGLEQPAQILVDRWGVPHIYAQSQDDVFFAQGFNAARDRLFQIDLWRRRGLGKLASIFGPGFVEQDRAARLFLYRGDMQKEWNAYGKDAERIARRFTAGVNAYIDYVMADTARLPLEFRLFGYAPEKWQAEDVVRIRSHGLTRNLASEFSRATVACQADLKSDEVRAKLMPPWETKLPEGLDPCLPKDVLRVFNLATQGVLISGRAKAPGAKADAGNLQVAQQARADEIMEGSNNWVIGPALTTTGRPILANDPHRAYSAPSLRYIAHLSAPGLDVIGAGEPALPGISIGHNGTIAFGLTIFSIDQEDLYVYETNPANSNEYKYQGKWEKMNTIREPIAVRGGEPITVDLTFTRHGPVIYAERDKNRAFAVRTGWTEPGTAPYFGSIDYMHARNFDEFKRAMAGWGAPGENQVYADVKGNIAWVPGGYTPIRANWDGLLPVPGDGRYEWAGPLPGDKLPFSLNPKQGWFASSNEMNLPPDYPYRERKIGFEWPLNSRYARAAEILSKPGKKSIEDSLKMQNDLVSITARRLIALIKPLRSEDRRTQAALKLLTSWNLMETLDSAPATLYEVWWSRHLGPSFAQSVLSKNAAALITTADPTLVVETMEKPEAMFGAGATARRDKLLLSTLASAYAELEALRGSDTRNWQWGKIHHSLIAHPLANAVDEATRARLNVGPYPKQGGGYTLNVSGYNINTFQQTAGPSFRVVIDVGNWDNSRAINTPGQSGDPDNPHYRDLNDMWLKGEYFPLLYSRHKVEAATIERFELKPAK
jgi:penicillin amidase